MQEGPTWIDSLLRLCPHVPIPSPQLKLVVSILMSRAKRLRIDRREPFESDVLEFHRVVSTSVVCVFQSHWAARNELRRMFVLSVGDDHAIESDDDVGS